MLHEQFELYGQMCLKQIQLQNLSSSYAEEHTLHRCEMYLNSTDTQNSFFNLEKLPHKYDVSFTQKAPTNHYLLQTLTKPSYEFHKSIIGRLPKLSKYHFIICKVIQLCNTGRLNFYV